MADQVGLFAEAGAAATDRLAAWAPQDWEVASDWQALSDDFFASATGRTLGQRIAARLQAGACIYPPQPLRALALTPLADVKAVILGQDPYHGPGQAEGLAFAVPDGVRPPPSLRNIHKELARQAAAEGRVPNAPMSLARWAEQGVLLLNTCLTVEEGQPASHAGWGWEVLTEAVLRAVLARARPVVFLLWGGHAQRFLPLIEQSAVGAEAEGARRLILTANHPSPLSANRPPQPFLGCGHFGLANAFLVEAGLEAVAGW